MSMIKTGEELIDISKAARIGELTFDHMLSYIKKGMTEIQIAQELENTLKELGGKGLAFPTIVVSGSRTCLPHGEPTEKIVEDGDLITLDFGCKYNGQCADMTRTVGIGYLGEEQIKIYNGEYFVHGTGHGVGKEVHEEPYINTRTNVRLEENMAVTIEPGIYLPDKMGVRIEDLAIITEFGIINLTKADKNLIIL